MSYKYTKNTLQHDKMTAMKKGLQNTFSFKLLSTKIVLYNFLNPILLQYCIKSARLVPTFNFEFNDSKCLLPHSILDSSFGLKSNSDLLPLLSTTK